jgi:L-rhamnose mutarotase
MSQHPINEKWQGAMSRYTPQNLSPVDAAGTLDHYFYIGNNRTMELPADGGLAAAGPPFDPTWKPQQFTGAGDTTKAGLKRVCFTLQFEAPDLDQYLKDHEAVWPEMQEALVATGWHDYSLFYRQDGFAVGFFLTDADFATCCARMGEGSAGKVNDKWQTAMSKYTPANVKPDEAAGTLQQYFYLGSDTAATVANDNSVDKDWVREKKKYLDPNKIESYNYRT